MNTTNLRLLFCLFLLQILDTITTKVSLDHGATEMNPIVGILMDNFGVLPAMIGFKSLIILVLFVLIYIDKSVRSMETMKTILMLSCVIYFILMSYNLTIMALTLL